jgi:hypothetical protein
MWMTVVGRTIAVPVFWGHAGPWTNVAILRVFVGCLLWGFGVGELRRMRGRRGKGKGE